MLFPLLCAPLALPTLPCGATRQTFLDLDGIASAPLYEFDALPLYEFDASYEYGVLDELLVKSVVDDVRASAGRDELRDASGAHAVQACGCAGADDVRGRQAAAPAACATRPARCRAPCRLSRYMERMVWLIKKTPRRAPCQSSRPPTSGSSRNHNAPRRPPR